MQSSSRYRVSGQGNVLIVLVAVNVLIMGLLTIFSPSFMTFGNISAILMRMSELSILAIAQTIVMINGGIDLSIGSVMALSGAVCGTCLKMGTPFGVCIILALLSGVAVGVLNGFLVVNINLQPFIVTIATNTLIRSIEYAILRGNIVTGFPAKFIALGDQYLFKIPFLFIFMMFTFFCAMILIKKTKIGRRIISVGANESTAFISGVYVKRTKYLVYIISGFLCAVAGLLFVIRIGAAVPDTGLTAPLEVITAVLIGGTAINGGKGSLFGSLLGILAMYLLLNGFSLLGLNPYFEMIIMGTILIVVVGQESIGKILKGRARK